MSPSRRAFLAGAAAAPLAAPAPARAGGPMRWRMATAWTKNLLGPGVSSARLAERITAMSGGRLVVEVFPVNTIVPAFGVFDAVAQGVVEMGHSAALFWEGKMPGVSLFTTAPFGMGPVEHQSWIEQRGGQALWDELYAPHGVRGFLAGNTGAAMGGWFRKPVESLADVRGLRIRVTGLGAEVYEALGATPLAIPPSDVTTALERGAIDAVELLSPVNDAPLGLHRHARYYYMPGFNKPSGPAEALISRKAFDELPADLRAIVTIACAAEHSTGLAEAFALNAEAMTGLVRDGAQLMTFPSGIVAAARKAAEAVLDRKAATSPLCARIVASYREAMTAGRNWGRVEQHMAHSLRGI
jgi:TRAP-type mannitol/chloroaromatic compound transport system substrate-binding protein